MLSILGKFEMSLRSVLTQMLHKRAILIARNEMIQLRKIKLSNKPKQRRPLQMMWREGYYHLLKHSDFKILVS